MEDRFDADAAFRHVERLAGFRRLPGTAGEREAQRYLMQAGEEIGVPMSGEEFTYSGLPLKVVLPLLCVLLGAVSLVGSLTYLWRTPLCAVPGAALLLMVYLGFRWSSGFEYFGARGKRERSLNLVGLVRGEEPKGTLILSAHYDSKSQVMPVVMRAVFFVAGFATAFLLGITLVVVGILAMAGEGFPYSRTGFFMSFVPAFFLVSLAFNFTGNRSPGALDNAAGEAVILEVARALATRPPANLNVLVVSFGCEELGLCGSINYLLEHEDELRSTRCYLINFDIPFSPKGNLYLNTGFELPRTQTSRYLNTVVRDIARGMGIEVKGIYLPVGAAADHIPWVKHGFEATAFISATTYIHRAADTPERINREGLRRIGDIALGMVRRLDREASS